jgi:hypothetical protein
MQLEMSTFQTDASYAFYTYLQLIPLTPQKFQASLPNSCKNYASHLNTPKVNYEYKSGPKSLPPPSRPMRFFPFPKFIGFFSSCSHFIFILFLSGSILTIYHIFLFPFFLSIPFSFSFPFPSHFPTFNNYFGILVQGSREAGFVFPIYRYALDLDAVTILIYKYPPIPINTSRSVLDSPIKKKIIKLRFFVSRPGLTVSKFEFPANLSHPDQVEVLNISKLIFTSPKPRNTRSPCLLAQIRIDVDACCNVAWNSC